MKKVLIVSFILLLLGGLYISKELLSITTKKVENKKAKILLDSDCNLQKKICPFVTTNNKGTIEVSPRPFYLNSRINVIIRFTKKQTLQLTSFIEGLDMDMNTGYQRHDFKSDDSIKYSTSFLLPTCTKDYMPWQLSILIKDSKDPSVNIYKFLAEKK